MATLTAGPVVSAPRVAGAQHGAARSRQLALPRHGGLLADGGALGGALAFQSGCGIGVAVLDRRQGKGVVRRQAGVARAGIFDFFTGGGAKKREELKQELLETCKPLGRGASADEEAQQAVEEIVQKLEKLNPNKAPLASPLINGKWELQYTTSDSIIKKRVPKFLKGPIYQCIDTNTLQARNIETWPLFNQVQATITPLSPSKVDVKFDKFKIAGLVGVKAPDSAGGSLDITYLDEDLRIARGNKGNLFVLTMNDPTYTISKSIDLSEVPEDAKNAVEGGPDQAQKLLDEAKEQIEKATSNFT